MSSKGLTPSKVREIMNTKVLVLRPEQTVGEASQIFNDNNISGAPVVDAADRLVGIITETDILKAIKPFEKRLSMVYPSLSIMSITFKPQYKERELALTLEEIKKIRVEEVMTRDICVVGPEDSIQKAVLIMNGMGINRLPVVEGTKVVGILTRGDIIRFLAQGGIGPVSESVPKRPKSG